MVDLERVAEQMCLLIQLYCVFLHGISFYLIVLQGMSWYFIVLHGLAWYCMVLYCIQQLGGHVVDLEQVGEQMRLFIMACQVAALKQCVSSI